MIKDKKDKKWIYLIIQFHYLMESGHQGLKHYNHFLMINFQLFVNSLALASIIHHHKVTAR
ncbi:hypothetical protein DS660_23695 [Salmonella enterica subsp. salamae]|nr:hypothetical protein [Salmonella enterica subsp. salamae]